MQQSELLAVIEIGDGISCLALVLSFIALVRTQGQQEQSTKVLIEEKRTRPIQAYTEHIDRLWGWKGRLDQILSFRHTDPEFDSFLKQDPQIIGPITAGEDLANDAIDTMIDSLNGFCKFAKHDALDAIKLEQMLHEVTEKSRLSEIEHRAESLYASIQATHRAFLASRNAN